jgi:hypothetical protein
MKMTTMSKKKLSLSTTTLRNLSGAALQKARGGAVVAPPTGASCQVCATDNCTGGMCSSDCISHFCRF